MPASSPASPALPDSRNYADAIRRFLTESLPDELCAFPAQGMSMLPNIAEGDMVSVRRVAVENLRMGDVVVFYHGGGHPKVHRFIWKRRDGDRLFLYAKGDAVPCVERFEPDALVGRVESVERSGVLRHEWKEWRLARAISGCAAYAWRRLLRPSKEMP